MATEQQREIFKIVRRHPEALIEIKPPLEQTKISKLKTNRIVITAGLEQYTFTGESMVAFNKAKRLQRSFTESDYSYKGKLKVIKDYIGFKKCDVKHFLSVVPFTQEELHSTSRSNKENLMVYKYLYTVWLLLEKETTLAKVQNVLGLKDHASVINRVINIHKAVCGFDSNIRSILDEVVADIKLGSAASTTIVPQEDMEDFLLEYYGKDKVAEIIKNINPFFGWHQQQ